MLIDKIGCMFVYIFHNVWWIRFCNVLWIHILKCAVDFAVDPKIRICLKTIGSNTVMLLHT